LVFIKAFLYTGCPVYRLSCIQVVLRLWNLLASGNLAELKVLDWTLVDANPKKLADGESSNIPVFILTRS
jgi:hypothetical protein